MDSFTSKAWDRVGKSPHYGINLPLFAIRSQNNCGIGEILDLIPLINWCESIGFDVVQLLPLNDTGIDPSPYNALSSIAIHPIYLSLKELPFIESDRDLQIDLVKFDRFQFHERLDYQNILLSKIAFLKNYHQKWFSSLEKELSFKEFIKQKWLKTYALFKVLKEKHRGESWNHWHEDLQNPTSDLLDKLYAQENEEMNFYFHVQYLLFEQLKKVKRHAESKGVFLKGDIPILISPDSHDVWAERKYFDTNLTAGAPPDMFSRDGQNWGFPIYKWDELEKENYGFWKTRLQVASQFYHIYRIDHIIGFYRLWVIPKGKESRQGHFLPSDPEKMIQQGEKILQELVASTDMLPIGEDLGSVTKQIRKSLETLEIPGTKVPRWEKYYETTKSYIPFNRYPVFSLTTVSTHDSETLAEWWINNPKEAVEFASFCNIVYEPILSPKSRFALLYQMDKSASLFHIHLLSEYLALCPELVSQNPKDDRINIPGNCSKANWTFRFHPDIQEITSHKKLLSLMQRLGRKEPILT